MPYPEIVPNPRIDLLVTGATGQPMRSTTYSGVIRTGPSPITQVMGMTAIQGQLGTMGPHVLAMLLPDGLPYLQANLGAGFTVPEIAVQGAQEHVFVENVHSRFVPDPRGTPEAWVELSFAFAGPLRTVFSYRVTALVPPDAVPPPSS